MLKILLAAAAAGALGLGQDPTFVSERNHFYGQRGYHLAWTANGAPLARTQEAVRWLARAHEKGLDPADYGGPDWPARLEALRQGQVQEAARFDLELTEAVMRYLSDLRTGRANPGIYRDTAAPVSELLRRILEAADGNAAVRAIEPPFPAYWRTLEALGKYRELAAADGGELLPAISKPIEPGETYAGVPRLTRLLRLLGDLPEQAASEEPEIYTDALVEAVRRFQTRHGLEPDGRIGRATLAALNVPLRQRVRQLELALERWRWLPREYARPPILVNVPEFRLRALNTALEPALDMKIIAGRAGGMQTPLLAGTVSSVIFRPYWNAPLSILRNELLPDIERDPAYLAANNYEVVTERGEVVTRSGVTPDILARLRSGAYLLRQIPGPTNALGLVKFMFPNRYNVYLHDTPAKRLFEKTRRDFSHGCIRAERAPELVAWLLREEENWSKQRIEEAMHAAETLEVNLKRPTPILITYMTAMVLESGEVRFFEDIYRQDAALEIATSAGRGPRPRE
jgi:murein L,D-transpeptidase YcbB/YkuD